MLGSTIHIQNYPAFFISYDEPNANDNYSHNKSLIPNLQRIHGIKGIHNAHAKAAEQTQDWFWTIDGDCFGLPQLEHAHVILDNPKQLSCIHSFRSIHETTGLIYGNGSVKLWRKQFLQNVTHETTTDFYYHIPYWICSDILTETKSCSSEFHAFRSAYREVTKLTFDPNGKLQNKLNLNDLGDNGTRIKYWLSMGNHLKYGKFSILGAYCAIYDFYQLRLNPLMINDYDLLKNRFDYWVENKLHKEIVHNIINCEIPEINSETSKFIKNLQFPNKFSGLMT